MPTRGGTAFLFPRKPLNGINGFKEVVGRDFSFWHDVKAGSADNCAFFFKVLFGNDEATPRLQYVFDQEDFLAV